ncbi:amidohydrolase [Pseudoalteromonas sp. Ld20]|uniref:amidohydrolase n=1 Tax=Pseudoalteromonas sp. Ld20 TaxID=649165 RepID=UPI0038654783
MGTIKMNLATSVFALSCMLSGCGDTPPQASEKQTDNNNSNAHVATKVLYNADVYTVNGQQPWAEAVALQDNKIVFVGSNDDVQDFIGATTSVLNLEGKMVLPGFHDVHMHPLESASTATQFSIPSYATANEYIDAIYNASVQNPDATWLIGYGHEIATLLAMRDSPLSVINEAVKDRPVIIMEQTSHSMWVNSKALELAGITSQSKDPIGGVIGRDEEGYLDGILYDNAGNQVMELAMQSLPDAQQQDYLGLIEYTMPELNKAGITSISDARTYWQRGHIETWQRVADEDKLSLRVNLGLWAYPQMNDEKQIAKLKSLYQSDQNSLLKVNQVKFYMDGILVNTTAAMHEPYAINWLDLYGNKGLNYFSQARIEKYLTALENQGFDFNIHAIGDRGISEALNAIGNASMGKSRHRITHLEVIDPDDYKRFAQLNVIADAQVAGEFTNPAHWPEVAEFIGTERAQDLVPIKSLVTAGARLTLSSDWNVSTFDPLVGLMHAVTRAPQAITLEQAIAAYTINSAYAMRQDDLVGSIEVGKHADLVVLDKNLFNIKPDEITSVKVMMTLLDGEQVYKR